MYLLPPKYWPSMTPRERVVTHCEVVSWRKARVVLSCVRAMTWIMFWQVCAFVWAHPRGIKYHQRGFTTPSSRVNPRSRCEKTLPTLTGKKKKQNVFGLWTELQSMEQWQKNCAKTAQMYTYYGLACLNVMFRFDFSVIYVFMANTLTPWILCLLSLILYENVFLGLKRTVNRLSADSRENCSNTQHSRAYGLYSYQIYVTTT